MERNDEEEEDVHRSRSMDHPDRLIPLALKVVHIMKCIMKIYAVSKTHTLRGSDRLSSCRCALRCFTF